MATHIKLVKWFIVFLFAYFVAFAYPTFLPASDQPNPTLVEYFVIGTVYLIAAFFVFLYSYLVLSLTRNGKFGIIAGGIANALGGLFVNIIFYFINKFEGNFSFLYNLIYMLIYFIIGALIGAFASYLATKKGYKLI